MKDLATVRKKHKLKLNTEVKRSGEDKLYQLALPVIIDGEVRTGLLFRNNLVIFKNRDITYKLVKNSMTILSEFNEIELKSKFDNRVKIEIDTEEYNYNRKYLEVYQNEKNQWILNLAKPHFITKLFGKGYESNEVPSLDSCPATKQFLLNLFTNEDGVKAVNNLLSYKLHQPFKMVPFSLFFQSPPQFGKSTFQFWLQKIFGLANTIGKSFDDNLSNFNGWADSKLFVFSNEISPILSNKTLSMLKDIIMEENITIHNKNQTERMQSAFHFIMFFSNYNPESILTEVGMEERIVFLKPKNKAVISTENREEIINEIPKYIAYLEYIYNQNLVKFPKLVDFESVNRFKDYNSINTEDQYLSEIESAFIDATKEIAGWHIGSVANFDSLVSVNIITCKNTGVRYCKIDSNILELVFKKYCEATGYSQIRAKHTHFKDCKSFINLLKQSKIIKTYSIKKINKVSVKNVIEVNSYKEEEIIEEETIIETKKEPIQTLDLSVDTPETKEEIKEVKEEVEIINNTKEELKTMSLTEAIQIHKDHYKRTKSATSLDFFIESFISKVDKIKNDNDRLSIINDAICIKKELDKELEY
jgi:hypothetical protein